MTKAAKPGSIKRPKTIDLAEKDPGLIRALYEAYESGVNETGTWGLVVQLRRLARDIRLLATQSPRAVPDTLLRAAREVDWYLTDRYGKTIKQGQKVADNRGPLKIVGEVRDRGDLAPLYAAFSKRDPDWEEKTRALFVKKNGGNAET